MTVKGGYWREAATVILAGRCPLSTPSPPPTQSPFPVNFDYKILMLKRSQKSKFMPETQVFPGGAISDADFSLKWDKLYRSVIGQGLLNLGPRFLSRVSPAPLFSVKRPGSILPAEIAFRICAIRETFEECGVLLITKTPESSGLVKPETSHTLNLPQWRRRVNKDAGQFLELCHELKVVPNIWGLYEWCNWLTPVMQKVEAPPPRPRRFDTMFYVCCLTEIPNAKADKRETTVAQWKSPGELIGQHHRKETEMVGPQLYELSRLCNFQQVSELERFCVEREPLGIERWLPVIVLCSDGLMTVLPGDDLYPENPDYDGTRGPWFIDKSLAEMKAKNRHGSTQEDGIWTNVIIIEQRCGHVPPLGFHKLKASM